MNKAKFIQLVQKRISKFNNRLNEAIEEMGDNAFYYPANESTVVGEFDMINELRLDHVDTVVGDETTEWQAVVISDGEEIYAFGDDTGWKDFDSLDDTIKYLNKRIKRTLRLFEMSAEEVDLEFEKEMEGEL